MGIVLSSTTMAGMINEAIAIPIELARVMKEFEDIFFLNQVKSHEPTYQYHQP
jgi:hypothetical protein